jgi:hypothetical protein
MEAGAWIAVILAEAGVLFLGQRFVFGAAYNKSKLLTYFLVAPGTALHELSHWIMCIALRVPAEAPVLFKPETNEDGSMTLGYVNHAETDPFRGALVAIAPVLLVPLLLLFIFIMLFGTGVLKDPIAVIEAAAIWKIVLAAYITLSAGTGAFPSPGDHIGFIGGLMLIALVGIVVYLVGTPVDIIRIIAIVWAPAAVSALLMLLLLHGPRVAKNGS